MNEPKTRPIGISSVRRPRLVGGTDHVDAPLRPMTPEEQARLLLNIRNKAARISLAVGVAVTLMMAAVGIAALFFLAIALTSDEGRPALMSNSAFAQKIAEARIAAVQEFSEAEEHQQIVQACRLLGYHHNL